ncbi:hypothetical protein [Vitiosangium sp. GDMCC 1.1324]|uniref:hypothetical protein n=1 Tax=Vitiosangium sp. (strain GDMCC 1.1324) TaxID=2138576 RepID=UPI000D3B946B|nr:hypothetical protein [Vitiosangium sp. GDMCC 1.1324]PTL80369.1 hypothetical protein DAT35_27350 [Vitiosangium sp. GDMCC 1.1324]
MTTEQSPVLEFPAILYGSTATILRKVRAEGRWWAREYLKTGVFPQPRQMRQVPPDEVLVVRSAAEFDSARTRWWVHLFGEVFINLDEGVPKEERQRTEEAFESFCLSTPWGALYYAVSPPPPRSAERTASRLASVLRFWDVLQGPRYAFWLGKKYTLEELMDDIYRKTLEAWCPGGPASIREHMTLTVERMARATREDCLEAVLRLMPVLVEEDTEFKHREVLSDPDFLRERLSALPLKKFESISSAYKYTVTIQLADWDRELGRH